jgi:transcriptional regulator with PAS, ATPase and Fis domain
LIEITSLKYLDQFFLSVDFAEEILKYFFLNPYEGLNVVNKDGIILYLSPPHEKFLKIEHGKGIGLHTTKILKKSRLHIVAKTGKAEIGKTMEMRGLERIVARIPIKKDGQTVGAIGKVMFRDLYQLKDITRKAESLKKQVDYYKKELTGLRQTTFSIDKIIGKSSAIERLKMEIKKAAQVDLPVLILGETGTGKELVAHTIHNLSHRGKNPMMIVNIAAIPPELFESELFGYEAGSFTDADKKGKLGKFELANSSSIFLDEIGDLPFGVQSKLLRVLQEGFLEKIGSKKLIKSDFRIISATNKDIDSLLEKSRFRLDLFYRINALSISVPPLRERKEDIPILTQHFIEQFNCKYDLHIKGAKKEVIYKFKTYYWPGNVRELQNEIGRACCFSRSDTLGLEDFSSRLIHAKSYKPAKIKSKFSRKLVLDTTERDLILEALRKTGGNKLQAAKLLGLSRTMLYKKIKGLNIELTYPKTMK